MHFHLPYPNDLRGQKTLPLQMQNDQRIPVPNIKHLYQAYPHGNTPATPTGHNIGGDWRSPYNHIANAMVSITLSIPLMHPPVQFPIAQKPASTKHSSTAQHFEAIAGLRETYST